MKEPLHDELAFEAGRPSAENFYNILQDGFQVQVPPGCSIRNLLSEHLCIDPAYVSSRIQTVVLDGKPVDDLDNVRIRDGSRLALSGALPGLVGSMVRLGSPLASLRSAITCPVGQMTDQRGSGTVHVRLFNLVMGDLGPLMLEHGLLVAGSTLMDFLRGQAAPFWQGFRRILLNGAPVACNFFAEDGVRFREMVVLRVVEAEEAA